MGVDHGAEQPLSGFQLVIGNQPEWMMHCISVTQV